MSTKSYTVCGTLEIIIDFERLTDKELEEILDNLDPEVKISGIPGHLNYEIWCSHQDGSLDWDVIAEEVTDS